ncbi:RelA/SpoT family protein [Calditrichota bacterium LG24]
MNDKTLIQRLRKTYDSQIEDLIRDVKAYDPDVDEEQLRLAYRVALEAHARQRRQSGEPYFEHCLQVARILVELHMDAPTIIAALLHDTVEDTYITLKYIEEHFGERIAWLVDGVTKIGGLRFQSKEMRQAETFRKMLLSMVDDIRVIIIKFADRLHNMRTLDSVPDAKKERIAIETRDVYAPLAHRLGIARIKTELEDLSLKYLDPKAYKDIRKKVKATKKERENYIQRVKEPIEKELKAHNIEARIVGRPKSFFSIYNKMKVRNKPFEEIYDLFAIRIIVKRIEECYYVLGIVHSLYMPVSDRFKDYIATPKINGYQSLHTTIVGPDGKMVEIQIRTEEMHYMAEDGIAAHWRYKHGILERTRFDEHLNWIKDLLERQISSSDPGDFLEDLKIDLFQDEVFVFSPRGDLFKLPRGATAVDFAYAVHTSVGNHCIAAKINGKIVPLKTELKSGQQVEIITSQNQKPNQDWLSFVKTSKARHCIRKVLREEQMAQTLKMGEEILNRFLKKHRLTEDSEVVKQALPKIGFQNLENLKVAIGRGEFMIENLERKLFPEQPPPPKKESFFVKFLKRARGDSGIKVHGMDDMLINFARCCQPVPGDRIIGYLTRGRGITIHRTDCKNMVELYKEKERIIDVEWDTEGDQKFQVQLSIVGEDRKNLLKDITTVIAKLDINIFNASFHVEEMYARGVLDIEVKNLQHLTKIINAIRKINGVFSVERVEDISSSIETEPF